MQDSESIPHSWKAFALWALSILLSGGVGWYGKRKLTSAVTEKTDEETREMELANDLRSGEAVINLITRLAQATERAERMKVERDHWKARYIALEKQKLGDKLSINHLPPISTKLLDEEDS